MRFGYQNSLTGPSSSNAFPCPWQMRRDHQCRNKIGAHCSEGMRWDKTTTREQFGFPLGGVERLISRTSPWIGYALFDF